MIYVTGDTHRDFKRFTRRQRDKLPFSLGEDDWVIVCGDFGLLWAKDASFAYNLEWLSRLPFRILWVGGNHENYHMIQEYPIEEWHGGKVRHIVRDKIIFLERGQVYNIDNRKIFAFGGASSHDIQGGILDKSAPSYLLDLFRAQSSGFPYRVLNESWWAEELPTVEEMQEGRNNLEKVGYEVDYVITHCAANSVQKSIERYYWKGDAEGDMYSTDVLTQYFEELEGRLQYRKWYFGHYHDDFEVDEKHTLLYYHIMPIEDKV